MKKGFTLVELFLAISIFSILAVSLYSVFNIGITAWRRMEVILERYQDLRLLMDRIGLELRNCLDLDIEGNFNIGEYQKVYDFQGEKNKMVFYTLKENKIKRIVYKVEKDEKKSKELEREIFLLKRDEKNFSPFPFEDKDFQGEAVLDLVKEIKFFYLERKSREENWQESWGGDDKERKNLPTQVKIKIVFYIPTYIPIGRRLDYQEISIERYVDIVTSPREIL